MNSFSFGVISDLFLGGFQMRYFVLIEIVSQNFLFGGKGRSINHLSRTLASGEIVRFKMIVGIFEEMLRRDSSVG
jgi:hypothetical protein